ncbi:DUF4232 domain-containing protein [Streptomyces sp. ITFR-16]|uniref:DUF4232 domain-containing protein n=1 Tax=Streptomyces sp. ITFR-16 TaxID=3075198 RepID=UPI0028890E42|nr:DUF4232 domain-containing protein [Streptomyces sp. ITFR-16]WNI26567.1 DUF4232 domain-containing protein [Streptomyces sp. ITFR-16]
MGSLTRTTGSSSERIRLPRSRRTAGSARAPRRRVLAPVALASVALVTAGCGDTSAPAGAAHSAPSSAAQDAQSPFGTQSPQSSAPAGAGTASPGSTARSSEPAGTASEAGASRRCTADHLSMSLGRADAGAGQIYYRLTFVNKADQSCTLHGFPGVSLIRRDGSAVGVPAEREGGTRAQTVIGAGKSAGVSLHTLNQGINGSACWGRADYLRVYPPGSKEALTLRDPQLRVCGGRFTTTAVGR